MLRVGDKWVTVVLIALFASMWTVSFAMTPRDATVNPGACHGSGPIPKSPDSHGAEHACCGAGHNQILLSGKVELPSLQAGSLLEKTSAALTFTAAEVIAPPTLDSSPPLQSSPPIRI